METNEGRTDAMDTMSEATETAAGMLPLDMVNMIAELADPAAIAKDMPWLAGEMAKIALDPDNRWLASGGKSTWVAVNVTAGSLPAVAAVQSRKYLPPPL